ncbi:cysteine desulfurase [Candidatus Binatia bacterium]|nr:cysteine desulfurase [Candidatus Binatia bacterium]
MIYCDHNATSPLRPEVRDAMAACLNGDYGNPSSVHRWGARARLAVEEARARVAELVGAVPAEIVFTSGGTESIALAIHGVLARHPGGAAVTATVEHAAVLAPLARWARQGRRVTVVPVGSDGRVAVDEVAAACGPGTALVSIGWANNEVGTVQPIAAIAEAVRAAGAVLHVDAVQAAGKIPVTAAAADLVSMSAHKLGGPPGVGALVVRGGIAIEPLLLGGGQERERRAGTENVPGIVGFGVACRLAAREIGAFGEFCVALRDRLWAGLAAAIPGVRRNGPLQGAGLPNTLNVSFDGVRGEALVAALDLEGIAVSSGSACAAGAGEPSHVLIAMGRSAESARDGVRFSFGRGNSLGDVDRLVAATAAAVARMRAAAGGYA